MVEHLSDQNVPPKFLEMLRIFLAASSRSENAVLVLETRKGTLKLKYRTVETVAGPPATTSTSTTSKRNENPARARRSRLRMEQFARRKLQEKSAGAGVSSSTKLILELDKAKPVDEPVDKNALSPILQVDGVGDKEKVSYTFHSEYGEEDILDSLDQMFPDCSSNLMSRIRTAPLSADHKCTVEVQVAADQKNKFIWPKMNAVDAEIFLDLKKTGS